MKQSSFHHKPIEVIFDIFIAIAIFAALAVSFILVLQVVNSNEIVTVRTYLFSFA